MKRLFVFFLFLFCVVIFTYGQGHEPTPKFVKMMKDPKVNFYDVQKEFKNYFKNRDKGRGTGWKIFKRWEYLMESRLFPTGERTNLVNPWEEVQKFNESFAGESTPTWTELGPNTFQTVTGGWNPGIGRINDIELDPNNSNIIYIGTPSGGLWRSTTGGNSWTPLTDDLPAIGVSCILIDPSDSNVIYIGTGDKDAWDCWSRGVLKSTDGGATWNTTGMTFVPTDWQKIHKMLMHPTSYNTLFAGTYYGLYKSTDGAATWTLVLDGDVDDIEFKPGDPNVVYAVTNEVPSPIFYRSTNGGNSFTATSMTSTRRSQIAVTPANPGYVYYFSKDAGTYRSQDSGVTWARKGRAPTAGSQDWYDLAIAVSPLNADEVHVGEIETFVSFDGGKKYTKTAIWSYPNNTGYVHADIHEMQYFGTTLYVGSDGMITTTDDSASSWVDLSEGLAIRQFYRMGSKVNANPYKLVGGSQDNGTSVYSTDHWHEWLGADGMECVIDYTNENIVYGCIQYGSFYKSTDGGNNSVNISQPGDGDWVTPYVIDPLDPNTLYVGNAYVRKTTDGMGSWTTIGNFGTDNVNALAVAKSDPNYIYAAKDDLIWRTTDGGSNWTEISTGLPGYFITYIDVHPSNPQKIAVTLSNFWIYAAGEKVYISNDAGTNWVNHSGSLPNLPVNCVVWQDGAYEALYVGMDVGVYYRDNTLTDWISYTGNLPNVMVDELEIDENIQKVRVATFGRGLWEVDVYRAASMAPVANFTADNTTVNQGGTVNFTDLSTNSPTSWSWTFEGGTPPTSALQNPSVTYNSPGNYTVSLTATNSSGSDTETKNNYITVLGQLPTYCSSSGTTFNIEWISNVTIDSFANSSGAAGYSDFTGLIVQLTAGSNASVTLTPGKAPGKPQTEYWKIRIDVNADGDFDDPGEEVFSASGNNAVTGSFTVPSSVVYTGLRVSMKRGSYPTPCETFAYGEVEDYAVNITGAGAASAAAKNSAFTVSMNPAGSQLQISHPKYKGSLLINIYNNKGSLVRKIMHNGGKTKQVNIADLPAGAYSMILHDGKSKVERYFVKK